jgi:hypothetical protein
LGIINENGGFNNMALKGELKGLDNVICTDCGAELPLQVCHSNAGFYLGHYCNNCGPYSRETGYFPTREIAETELKKETPDKLRNTDFVPGDLGVEEIDWPHFSPCER